MATSVLAAFIATKLFLTVEGGCITSNDDIIIEKLKLFRQFGHVGDEYLSMGINAKNSEFHAMGLSVLPHLDEMIASRKRISEVYQDRLKGMGLRLPELTTQLKYNYAYYPVIFESEQDLIKVMNALILHEIHPLSIN